jgi:hypothetical protein
MAARIRTAETDPLWCGQAGCGEFIFQPWVDENGDWKGSDGHRHWPQGGRTGSTRRTTEDQMGNMNKPYNRTFGAGHRTAASKFLADQNTDDREELLFRAHRYASDRTGQLPVPTAQRVVQDFVSAVNAQIPRRRRVAARPMNQHQDFADELLY